MAREYRDVGYDALDHENSRAVTEFFLNSIETTLRRRLTTCTELGNSFAMVWLRLMSMMTSHSSKSDVGYDALDHENSGAATEFLLNSIGMSKIQ